MRGKNNFTILYCSSDLVSTMGDVSASHKLHSQYEKTGEVVWDIQTKEKVIALTFDDGPHPIYTTEILDLLAQHDTKATFF